MRTSTLGWTLEVHGGRWGPRVHKGHGPSGGPCSTSHPTDLPSPLSRFPLPSTEHPGGSILWTGRAPGTPKTSRELTSRPRHPCVPVHSPFGPPRRDPYRSGPLLSQGRNVGEGRRGRRRGGRPTRRGRDDVRPEAFYLKGPTRLERRWTSATRPRSFHRVEVWVPSTLLPPVRSSGGNEGRKQRRRRRAGSVGQWTTVDPSGTRRGGWEDVWEVREGSGSGSTGATSHPGSVREVSSGVVGWEAGTGSDLGEGRGGEGFPKGVNVLGRGPLNLPFNSLVPGFSWSFTGRVGRLGCCPVPPYPVEVHHVGGLEALSLPRPLRDVVVGLGAGSDLRSGRGVCATEVGPKESTVTRLRHGHVGCYSDTSCLSPNHGI